MSDNLIEIRDLSFAYGQRLVLKDINLTARHGQVIAIMGNSGCGKTTLLRLIGGALKPTSGSLMVDGVDMGQLDQGGL